MASANAYDIGDLVRCTGTFRNLAGELADPTTVDAKVLDPAGVTHTFTGSQVVKDVDGIYFIDVAVDLTGLWTYRFEGTGALVNTEEGYFYVERSAFETGS